MKLEPIAKPIRIRIKLGKSEFSSLDSVKNNFALEELYPLFLDGRLDRWLTQIGEDTFAREVKEMSTQCTEGSMRGYILFLSLFFDEVSLKGHRGNWSIEQYLAAAPLSSWEIVYEKTKKLSRVDWKHHLSQALSKKSINIIDVLRSKSLYEIFDSAEWGLKIEQHLSNAPLATLLQWYLNPLFRTKASVNWGRLIRPLLSIEKAKSLYKSQDYSTIFSSTWGIVFADLIQDWDSENEAIEGLLKQNVEHLNAFRLRCSQRGFKKAENKLDLWYVLSKSKDYPQVLKTIRSWDIGSYKLSKEEYSSLETDFAREILALLQFLRGLYLRAAERNEVLQNSRTFSDEIQILIAVRAVREEENSFWDGGNAIRKFVHRMNNELVSDALGFGSDAIRKLAHSMNNELANYVLKQKRFSYPEIATYFVKSILLPKVRSLQGKS